MSFFGRTVGAVSIAGAALLGTSAPALADPPNCTAADLAGVMSGVTTATSAYLFTHPDVNAFFTSLKNVPKDERREQLQSYMDANPQVHNELRAIRQPAVDFRNRCDVPIPEPE